MSSGEALPGGHHGHKCPFGLRLQMGKLRPRKAASFRPPADAKTQHHTSSPFLPDSFHPQTVSCGCGRCGVGGAEAPWGDRGMEGAQGWGRLPHAPQSSVTDEPPAGLISFTIPRIPESRPSHRSNYRVPCLFAAVSWLVGRPH